MCNIFIVRLGPQESELGFAMQKKHQQQILFASIPNIGQILIMLAHRNLICKLWTICKNL